MAEPIDTYSGVGLDAAVASIVAIAERLDQTVIATLDECDFRVIRAKHTEVSELLPGLA